MSVVTTFRRASNSNGHCILATVMLVLGDLVSRVDYMDMDVEKEFIKK